jgi:hypothetical protein
MSAPARRHEAGEIRSPDGSLPDRRHANDLLRLRPLSGFDHLDMALIPCHLFDSPGTPRRPMRANNRRGWNSSPLTPM